VHSFLYAIREKMFSVRWAVVHMAGVCACSRLGAQRACLSTAGRGRGRGEGATRDECPSRLVNV